jgi:hypothetical protein
MAAIGKGTENKGCIEVIQALRREEKAFEGVSF